MKNERPDLSLTIAQLARSATPVTPLPALPVRLVRWALTVTALAVVSVVILGVRADVASQLTNSWFVARATATLAIAVAAAVVALLMSVPGVEPSGLVRALPLAACLAWAAMLIEPIVASPSPVDALRRVPAHPACVLFIAATAVPAGIVAVRMLRHAAPLHPAWTGGMAGLASLAAGALGAQVVCSNDNAAHHLLWHLSPVVVLALSSVAAGSLWFDWPRRRLS